MRYDNPTSFYSLKHLFCLTLIVMFVYAFSPSVMPVCADVFNNVINIDAQTSVDSTRYYYDRSNGELRFTATITNTSDQPLRTPMLLAFSGLPQGITLVTNDMLSDGTACINYTDQIAGGMYLQPGATTEVRQIAMTVTGRLPRFRPVISVWGQPVLSVTASASPASGPSPLAVAFSVQTAGDVDLYEWDFEGDGIYDWSSTQTGSTTHTYTPVGNFPAKVRVTGNGLTATDTVTISTSPGLWAEIGAVPKVGVRPLTVVFTPGGQSTGPSITGYRWDFDGNGSWDTGWSARPNPTSHVYNAAGVYEATLQIRDEIGRYATASIDITVNNAPPTANVTVLPTNGPLPLNVTFTVSASSPNGAITSVVVDPADGSTPYALGGSGSVSHEYSAVGTYQAVITVTDAVGESVTVRSPLVDVRVGPEQSPTANASASPTFGSAPLNVSLSAAGSSDPDGSLVLYEWDFDYDGTFVADSSSPTTGDTNHSYTAAGQHIAALRVTDNDGMSAIDVVAVTVDLSVGLSVADDTINAYKEETSDVVTTLSAGANVEVYVQSRPGVVVRRLFTGYRDSGTYHDSWDGRDDSGNIAPDADYYAYIDYQVGGITKTEPDTASGGNFGWVSGTQNISGFGAFDPWDDEFWELTFDTTRSSMGASEVTLWITIYTSGTIIDTPYNREVFGTGQYKCWWDGITDEGKYVTASDRDNYGYLWSAQAWRLPDNTIVVEGGRPWITDPSANPNWFWPATTLCLGAESCDIQFTIDTEIADGGGGNALNATAAASSNSSYAPRMLDGNTYSYWYSGSGMPQWVQLDFPQQVTLDGIYIDHYTWYYSPDGVEITLSNGYSQQTAVNRTDNIQIDIPEQTDIDWIRVQTTGSSYYNHWCIRELQVNGEIQVDPQPGGEGLATVTLNVFKMSNGKLLNSITTDLLPAGTHTISWDGKTASGDEYVAPGSYRLELTARTPNGDVSFLRRVLVKVKY